MEEIIWFTITFILIYVGYVFLILKNKKALEKYKHSKEVSFLVRKYQLSLEKINFKNFANKIFLINSFLISFTISMIVNITDQLILMAFLALGILVPLIYLCYSFLGKSYQRKEK